MTERPRAKGIEESIPRESGEMGVEALDLEMCPGREGPENDSEEMLK